MTYRVIWISSAESDLAELWLKSDHREALRLAVEAIDDRLSLSPSRFGESRDEDERIAFIEPLAVRFLVDEHSRVVYVFNVWEATRRRRG